MHRATSSACSSMDFRLSCRFKASRNSHACVRTNAVSAPGFDVKSNEVVTMKSSWQKTCCLTAVAGTDAVEQYTSNAQDYLRLLHLPLGAQFSPVDTAAQPAKWTLQLPELRFMSVSIRYSVDAAVSIRSTSDYKLHTSAVLTLAVDIPPMFRLTPKAMIQVTGTAVLSNVVSVLMEDYVKTMVRDIEELASVPAAPINLLENK